MKGNVLAADATTTVMAEGNTATAGATQTGGQIIPFARYCSPGHGVTQSPAAAMSSAMPDVLSSIAPT